MAEWLLGLVPVKCLGWVFLTLVTKTVTHLISLKMDEICCEVIFLAFNHQHLVCHDKPHHWFICLLAPLIWVTSQLITSLFHSSKNLPQNPPQHNILWRWHDYISILDSQGSPQAPSRKLMDWFCSKNKLYFFVYSFVLYMIVFNLVLCIYSFRL